MEEKVTKRTKQEEVQVSKSEKKTFDDKYSVDVRSNTFGGLTFESNTGEFYRWEEFGEVQQLSIRDIKFMKNRHPSFFKNQWVVIEDDEVVKFLKIDRMNNGETVSTDYVDVMFEEGAEFFQREFTKMSQSNKIIVLDYARQKVLDQDLTNHFIIDVLEKHFNVTLT